MEPRWVMVSWRGVGGGPEPGRGVARDEGGLEGGHLGLGGWGLGWDGLDGGETKGGSEAC